MAATLQLPAHHLGLALAQAGADVLACLANAQARVLNHSFAVRLRNRATAPDLGGFAARSRHITVIALLADVAAAPVDLFQDAELTVDSVAYRIVDRADDAQLGQTTLQLEALT